MLIASKEDKRVQNAKKAVSSRIGKASKHLFESSTSGDGGELISTLSPQERRAKMNEYAKI